MSLRNFTATSFGKCVMVAFGGIIYGLGIAVFINPLVLYAGGTMGFAQLLRTIIVDIMKIPIPDSIDLSGIIYYLTNIPLMVLAYRRISKSFFWRTMIGVTFITIITAFLTLSEPIIDDTLTSCIIGGIISGAGVGIMLMFGGSGGGMDIVGMYFAHAKKGASVGKVALIFNIILYTICALLFNVETAIYSIIYSVASSIAIDKMHYQNIMVEVMIFTKKEGVAEPIMAELGRGVTEWQGDGAYTKENTHILVTLVSKYEVNRVSKLVRDVDPKAFITYSQVSRIDGNFVKKLDA